MGIVTPTVRRDGAVSKFLRATLLASTTHQQPTRLPNTTYYGCALGTRDILHDQRRNVLEAGLPSSTPAAFAVHDYVAVRGRPYENGPQHSVQTNAFDERVEFIRPASVAT